MVDRIRLSLPDEGILTLRSLEIVTKGDASLPAVTAAMSSAAERTPPDKTCLLQGKPVVSLKERNPWWECRFATPVYVDRLDVFNRLSSTARRAYSLEAEWWGPEGAGRFGNLDPACVGQRLQSLKDLSSDVLARFQSTHSSAVTELGAALNTHFQLIESALLGDSDIQESLEPSRVDVLSKFDPMLRNAGRNSARNLKKIAAVVDAFIGKGSGDPKPVERRLAFAVLAIEYITRRRASSQRVKEMRSLITDIPIEQADAEVDVWVRCFGADSSFVPAIFQKHGLAAPKLVHEYKSYVSATHDVIDILRRLGYQSCICYGTLLGIIRTGTFIAHDDDVDLLYLSRVTNRDEMFAEMKDIIAAGQNLRVTITVHNTRKHLKVYSERTGKKIDAFPAVRVGPDKLGLYMRARQLEEIDANKVIPFGTCNYYGTQVACPADPEAVLEARYGTSWRTPDRLYGTPWAKKGHQWQVAEAGDNE
jgi:hypothetical protein